jgi:hypothetical protein
MRLMSWLTSTGTQDIGSVQWNLGHSPRTVPRDLLMSGLEVWISGMKEGLDSCGTSSRVISDPTAFMGGQRNL